MHVAVNSKRRGSLNPPNELIDDASPVSEKLNGHSEVAVTLSPSIKESVSTVSVRVVLPRDIKAHVQAGKPGLVDMTAIATVQVHKDE